MTKKLSVVIMAHPRRKEFIPYLKEKLGDVPVVWDEKNNVWDTCRRAWLAIDKSCEYGVVIQDDAIICDDFYERAEAILQGGFVYSLYAGGFLAGRINMAIKRGINHVLTSMIMNEVAICMKTHHINDMVKYCDDRDAQNDHIITRWCHVNRLRIYHPIPSLVDHRDTHSLYRELHKVPQADKPRKAVLFKQNLNQK